MTSMIMAFFMHILMLMKFAKMFSFPFVFLISFLFPLFLMAEEIYVIGDLHGDVDAFKKIISQFGLYDSQTEKWIGRKGVQLVLLGDLVDRGPEVKALMDLTMDLEKQALKAGSRVHTLIGNHEVLASDGIMDYVHSNDSRAFKRHPRDRGEEAYTAAFKGESIYAEWIRSRPTLLVLGENLFVHAGVEDWALRFTPEEVNHMVQNWLRFIQGVGPEPSQESKWVIGSNGPLWTRALAAQMDSVKERKNNNLLPEETLEKILDHYSVGRIFIGHSLVKDFDKTVNHPNYGSRVIMTDTGINSSDNLIVSGFKVVGSEVQAYWFNRHSGSVYRQIKAPKVPSLKRSCLKIWSQ